MRRVESVVGMGEGMNHSRRSRDVPGHHSRIAEEDVELRLLAEELLSCLLDGGEVREVDLQEDGLPPRLRLQRGDGGVCVQFTPRGEVDLCVMLQQHLGTNRQTSTDEEQCEESYLDGLVPTPAVSACRIR